MDISREKDKKKFKLLNGLKMTKEAPLIADILFGPIQKFSITGVFPWPMLVHMLLMIVDMAWLFHNNAGN